MSEREEVKRYDFQGDYGYCGCTIGQVDDGDFVSYDDYAALRSQLAAADSIAQAREALITALRADKDEARAQLTTAERERDEARVTVEAQRVVLDGMHRRAELSEHVVKAVAGLAEVDVINGGEYFDDICVQPVLAAYHRYALDAEEGDAKES